jgi:Na+/H+ antiporter NhaD/arsenite permease-like protein
VELCAGALALLGLIWLGSGESAGRFDQAAEHLGGRLPPWSAIPFGGLLLSIALVPLVSPRAWHLHYKAITAFWATAFAAPFVFGQGLLAFHVLAKALLTDYVPFVILLWALYTVSGGILLTGAPAATPRHNTAMLAAGALFASIAGTTGAAMLLVRPLLRMNAHRWYRAHVVVFFIYLVANIGGILTPHGDPPLFLGYLAGVPFTWPLGLWRELLLVAGVLLVVFFVLDTVLARRERTFGFGPTAATSQGSGFRVQGSVNLALLVGVLVTVFLSGRAPAGGFAWFGISLLYRNLLRDLVILVIGWLSWRMTAGAIRHHNHFSWHPIEEVVVLFLGIFITIVPILMILRAGTAGALAAAIRPVHEPWQYFWMTGGLSSVLDNAPTYLAFFNLALGQLGLKPELVGAALSGNLPGAAGAGLAPVLKAISLGAVFMGAMTYIGNAPNLMVLSIAMQHGVRMPSFVGYMACSVVVLVPTFLLLTWVSF